MARRSYRFNEETKQMEEIGDDYVLVDRRAQTTTEGITYANLQATDGTPLDSRKKHREYMKANGLAMESDFSETRAKAAEKREQFYAGNTGQHGAIKETLGRALHQSKSQRKRR